MSLIIKLVYWEIRRGLYFYQCFSGANKTKGGEKDEKNV